VKQKGKENMIIKKRTFPVLHKLFGKEFAKIDERNSKNFISKPPWIQKDPFVLEGLWFVLRLFLQKSVKLFSEVTKKERTSNPRNHMGCRFFKSPPAPRKRLHKSEIYHDTRQHSYEPCTQFYECSQKTGVTRCPTIISLDVFRMGGCSIIELDEFCKEDTDGCSTIIYLDEFCKEDIGGKKRS
jgi:hypothetical protein